MVATVASMGVLVTANVSGAMKNMDQVNNKVKDVGQTSQKESAKTEGFMKKWAGSFAVIGAAATGAMYAVVKASPLLSGALQEAQDAMSLLFMTIGDALEPIIRPFVDALWALSDIILDMPAPLDAITSMMIVFGVAVGGASTALVALPAILHSFGLAASMVVPHGLALVAAFSWIVAAAGLVGAALYYISGEPTVAIVGALTTIGVGATMLMKNPLILAITSIVSGFLLMATAADEMQLAAGVAFAAIGVAATALMGHPLLAVGVGLAAIFVAIAKASGDMKIAIEAAFLGIAVAATALMGHPAIAALVALIGGIGILGDYLAGGMAGAYTPGGRPLSEEETAAAIAAGAMVFRQPAAGGMPIVGGALEMAGITQTAPQMFGWDDMFIGQHGGYVPSTGPAFLHAGEYVLPAGKVSGGMGGGVVNVDYHPTIEISATLRDHMDVENLKRDLDDIYRRDIGRVV